MQTIVGRKSPSSVIAHLLIALATLLLGSVPAPATIAQEEAPDVAPAGAAARQEPVDSQHFQLRDVRLTMPSAGWERTDKATPDGKARVYLGLRKESGVHTYFMDVLVVRISPILDPAKDAAEVFKEVIPSYLQNSISDAARLKLTCTAPRQLTVAGGAYPVLGCSARNGNDAVDVLALLYYPGDRQTRQRAYAVSWFDFHPTSAQADTSLFNAAYSGFELVPTGFELLEDSLSNPATGQLDRASSGDDWEIGYSDGEYLIRKVNPEIDSIHLASVPSTPITYDDSTIAVDVRFVASESSPVAYLYCRRFGTPASGYRVAFDGRTERARLARLDDGAATVLVDWRNAASMNDAGQPKRLELSCSNDLISFSVNGQPVGAAIDSTYGAGSSFIGASMGAPVEGSVQEIRFANLTVAQA